MSADASKESLKSRAEKTLIGELNANPILRALKPRQQNSGARLSYPYLVVIATPGKEITPGARLHTIDVMIELHYNAAEEGAESLDMACVAVDEQLSTAQARGAYGVIKSGEQPQIFEAGTIRKRVITCQLIAG